MAVRCRALFGGVALILALILMAMAPAALANGSHGLSVFGELKYGSDFKHFDYVNPNAPKGGRMALLGPAARITFDSFNGYILKGDAAQGLEFLFDSLMVRAFDEPDAVYGLVAKTAELAPDEKSVTFRLRPEAKFADGSPLTADDVVFSFDALKTKGHPQYRIALRDVVSAEALDNTTVRYRFQRDQLRDLPLQVAALPIFSKTYYTSRNFEETSLEAPLGSGPYRISDFKQGTFTTFRRRDAYWAKDLPVNRGRYNFDEVRFEYYRDRTAQLESLKAGVYDLREEFTAKSWATEYDVPQVREGRLARLTLPDESPSGAQGFFLNMRRAKFADVRVRKAFDLAFDYEWTNRNIFYGLYTRTASYFENSDLKASGQPSAEELALLEPYREKLPPEVFAEPYVSPISDGSGGDRKLLRQAGQLLTEAGWALADGKRVDKQGEIFEAEFLIFEPTMERVLGPYLKNLQAIGVTATIRRVDPAQYERRMKAFDFDITSARFVMRLTPGVELKNFFGSDSAMTEGSFNLGGISDPVVDALIGKVLEATSRRELITATRALDRVLRAGHYWVPHWHKAAHNIVYWDKYARPRAKPKYDRGIVDTWWYDPNKAAKLGAH